MEKRTSPLTAEAKPKKLTAKQETDIINAVKVIAYLESSRYVEDAMLDSLRRVVNTAKASYEIQQWQLNSLNHKK